MLDVDPLSDAASLANAAMCRGAVCIGLVVAALVIALIVACLRRADPRPPTRDEGRGVLGSAVWPALVLVAMAWIGWTSRSPRGALPPDAVIIEAFARQWAWEFRYPDGSTLFNELVLPRGRAVKIVAISRDVAHSLVIPSLRVRLRALPGRAEKVWFRTSPGDTDVHAAYFCGEYCGVAPPSDDARARAVAGAGHHSMIGEVRLVAGKFEERVQIGLRQPQPTCVLDRRVWGELLYRQQNCNMCHSVDGSPGHGPTWLGLYGRAVPLTDGRVVTADESYLARSIADPNAEVVRGFAPVMPIYKGSLNDRQLAALVAYIMSLRGEAHEP